MKARILVGIVGVPALLGAVWMGFPALTVVVGVAAVVGLWEFNRMAKAWGADAFWPYAFLWTTLFVVHGQLAAQHGNFSIYLLAGGLSPLIVFALARRNRSTFKSCLHTAIGPLHVGFLLSHACSCVRGLQDWRTGAAGSSTPCS